MFSLARRFIKGTKNQETEEFLQAKSEVFRGLFPAPAMMTRVATGFRFTEGPVSFAGDRSLLFSDIPANQIPRLTSDGQVTIFRQPSSNANGLTRDNAGRLIACEHNNRRVTRTEQDGSTTVLADKFQGRKLNSPNDVVVKSDVRSILLIHLMASSQTNSNNRSKVSIAFLLMAKTSLWLLITLRDRMAWHFHPTKGSSMSTIHRNAAISECSMSRLTEPCATATSFMT